MKKSNLPKNWIVCNSKSYPDKVYYFNTVTNTTSWKVPVQLESQMLPRKEYGKKRKKGEICTQELRPRTPELAQESERPVLQAKRRISSVQPRVVGETPQMREIRERMLRKQVKLSKELEASTNAEKDTSNDHKRTKVANARKSNITGPLSQILKIETNVQENFSESSKLLPGMSGRRLSTTVTENISQTEGKSFTSPVPSTNQNMTPQMRIFHERIEKKKALKSGSSKKSLSGSVQSPSSSSMTSSSSSSASSSATSGSAFTSSSSSSSKTSSKLRRPKGSTLPDQPVENTVTTRCRSRLSTSNSGFSSAVSDVSNFPVLSEEKELLEIHPKNTPTSTTFTTRKSRRTILVQQQATEKEPDTTFKSVSLHPRTKFPKNIAKKRLENLRKSLSLEKDSNESVVARKRANLELQRKKRQSETATNKLMKEISDPGPESSIYANAIARAKAVRDRVLNYQNCSAKVNRIFRRKDVESEAVENLPRLERLKYFNNNPYHEEMEWEPIEDEKIMSELQAVRTQLYDTKSLNSIGVIHENILKLSPAPVQNKEKALCIVVDSNVFLSNLQAIEEAKDAVFKSFGRPFIVIPWTVLQELDFIKDDKSASRSETLKLKARKAVRFLHQHFSAKHPRVLGQTPADVARNREIFAVVCPDDEILQSCLQIQEAGRSVVLLSYDKNLCNKAMIHDIATLGRDDPLEKIDYLNINDSRNNSISIHHLSFNQEESDNIQTSLDKELLVADNIFEEAKAILLSLLSPVVATEMKNLYGEPWERYTIVRPPWSTKDVLKCSVKHWMAAVSESFTRRAEPILKELLETINHLPDGGRRLKDVSYVLERCSDLMQTLNQQKYPHLLDRTSSAMDALKKKCLEENKKLCEKRILHEIGYEDSVSNQNCRAEAALSYFNKVYAFSRDFCGVAAETLNMPCPFLFEKTDKRLNSNFVNKYQPVVAANLNHLLQILSLAIENINLLRPDHRAIIALTETLNTFFPDEFNDLNAEINPLDLFYCIKNKEDVIRRGLTQLQDLSQHFCRMASFRCK